MAAMAEFRWARRTAGITFSEVKRLRSAYKPKWPFDEAGSRRLAAKQNIGTVRLQYLGADAANRSKTNHRNQD
jgi:hypothetical protein